MRKKEGKDIFLSKISGQSVVLAIVITIAFFIILINKEVSKKLNLSLTAAVSDAGTQTITVASPNGGETWTTNRTKSIAWIFRGTGNVKIDLMQGNKVTRTIIRSMPGEAGSYNWNVPSGQIPADDYKIRVSSVNNTSINDASDNSFHITMGKSNGGDGDIETPADYIISTPGTIIKDKIISVSGSVIIVADDVTLKNVVIKCTGSSPTQDGISAINVNRLKVRLAVIDGCNRHGIYLKGGTGHDIAEGMISQIGADAVVFDNTSDSWLIGWELRGGIALKNGSHDNRIIANIVVATGQGKNHSSYPYSISADSYGNQIVRSRTRDNAKSAMTIISENPNNLWFQNVCDEVTGYANCFFRNERALDGDYGDRTKFSPRIWSICSEATTGHAFICDFETYEEATRDPSVNDGDVLVIDSKTSPKNIIPPITVSRPLWLIGNIMAQKGNYACEINIGDGSTSSGITVTSPGVRIENLQFDPSLLIRPDTDFVNIKTKNSTGHWVLIDTGRSLMPRLVPPGC